MKLILTVLFVLALTLFAFPIPASAGTTYYVATNGDNSDGLTWAKAYTTIQAAVTAADSNDTITVGSSGTGHGTGTYTENVDIASTKTGLTIQSESGYSTTIVQAASTSDHVFDVRADNVTISGFSVYGATSKAGIYLYGTSGNNTTDCTITSNRCGWDVSHQNAYGIHLHQYCSDNTISGNICSYNILYGIYLQNLDNSNTISGNTCDHNTDFGIIATNATYNTVTGNTCTNSNSYAGCLKTSSLLEGDRRPLILSSTF